MGRNWPKQLKLVSFWLQLPEAKERRIWFSSWMTERTSHTWISIRWNVVLSWSWVVYVTRQPIYKQNTLTLHINYDFQYIHINFSELQLCPFNQKLWVQAKFPHWWRDKVIFLSLLLKEGIWLFWNNHLEWFIPLPWSIHQRKELWNVSKKELNISNRKKIHWESLTRLLWIYFLKTDCPCALVEKSAELKIRINLASTSRDNFSSQSIFP